MKQLMADASSFQKKTRPSRNNAQAGTQPQQMIRDRPLNPTRARRLQQQNSPSPTQVSMAARMRSRIFK
jgi:hypothetical protein